MEAKGQAGYTIIEVTLFLAVSGLLFMVVLIGTGTTIRSVRFSDSGRAFTAFIQKQYDDIINGVNDRTDTQACTSGVVSTTGPGEAAGTSECILMGKLLVFEPGTPHVRTYAIVGTEPANVDFSLSDTDLIRSYNPQAATALGATPYDIPWQAYISGLERVGDNLAANALALIRSPRSSRIVTYSFKNTATPPGANLGPVVNDSATQGKTTNICIKNADGNGLPALVSVANRANQSAVQVEFDADEGRCDGA